MDPTRLDTIAAWAGGRLAGGDAGAKATVICTDSRSLKAGDLFLALRGEKFDGHDFLAQAAERGALGAVAEEAPADLPAGFALIIVPDTLRALQQIAAHYRGQLPMQVVAITGSNGKTSTKDFVASVLAERFQVTKTEGNLNNHIGLPLTLLRARASDQVGVVEIGMNHAGEVAPLAAMAAPDVAVITNVGVAHIEFLGSRAAIAQEKGMLAEALKPGGYLALNADDDFAESIAARTKADVVYTGLDRGEIRGSDIRAHFNGTRFTITADGRRVEAELSVPGEHMVRNALLAVAVGRIFGLSLEESAQGLGKIRLTKGRLEQKIIRGIHILDDTYNANPDSVCAAISTLANLPSTGRRIAVLGCMGELGPESERGHRRVGAAAVKEGLDWVIGVGADARWITDEAWRGGVEKVKLCETTEEALRLLHEAAHAGDIVLVKGSRSARMERIVEGL